MNKITRHYIESEGLQIHYYKSGDSKNSLLLFHESPQSGQVYLKAFPYLSRDFTVYAFDTPGYGMSDAPEKPLNIVDYSALLVGAIKNLPINNYATGGCHTGASIALEVIKQLGQQNALFCVLNGVPYFSEEERNKYANSWSPEVQIDDKGEHLMWAWNRYKNIYGDKASSEMINFGTIGILNCLDKYNWAYNAAFDYVPDKLIEELDVPILFLNTNNDLLTHCDIEANKVAKNSTISLHTDHLGQLHLREPEIYGTEVIKFYKTLS